MFIIAFKGYKMKEKKEKRTEEEFLEDIYTEEGMNSALDDDEISDAEHGFMQGYNTDEE